jgi:hypothetical protein
MPPTTSYLNLCTRPIETIEVPWDTLPRAAKPPWHWPSAARLHETGSNQVNLRRSAHNPEVAGSNPAPATDSNEPDPGDVNLIPVTLTVEP